jgi:hypothetical protein
VVDVVKGTKVSVGGASEGPATDRFNAPVIDPTANVIALTQAAVNRLDDLRAADQRYAELEARHITEVATLRAAHNSALREAETARIDAIRAVDVGAVQRAAEVAAAQAEALRNQVAAAATATAAALAAALDPIQKSIDDLRRAQYEAQGKQGQVIEHRAGAGAVYAALGAAISLLLAGLTVAAFVIANRP